MKKILLPLLVVFSLPSLAAQITTTPEQLTQRIHKLGVKTVVKTLASENTHATDQSEWEYIIGNIATGESAWLKIVPQIAPATDAGFAEDLGTALAQAIPKNVDGVMAVIDDRVLPINTMRVCSMPLYNESAAEQNDYFVKSVQALYKSNMVQAQKCLSILVTTVGQSDTFKDPN